MASVKRLRLGPIVGHTDDRSVRIWIRAVDDPALYTLTVHGVGEFQFVSTETAFEFGTAIAIAQGLRANHPYRYTVRRLGRELASAKGSFQTMPPLEYLNELSFAVISCSHQSKVGAWEELKEFIEDTKPRFLLMIGDQIYTDDPPESSIWEITLDDESSEKRRHLIAEKYQESWARSYVSEILANIPCYMMWDDHDIRDGWGSFAPDSPTLSARYPWSEPIHKKYAAYFEDARDVYWHFQMVHNPPPLINTTLQPQPPIVYQVVTPPYAASNSPVAAMPFVFRVGRSAILVVDNRGQRDVWREKDPILGTEQWSFLNSVVDNLAEDIDAVILVTPVPIVSDAPYGQAQLMVGSRTDDVEMFKKGDEEGLRKVYYTEGKEGSNTFWEGVHTVGNLFSGLTVYGAASAGFQINYGSLKLNSIDDLRDHWSHSFSRAEQERLIRLAARARTVNRAGGSPRGLLFVGGDLHAGGLFRIDTKKPACTFECLISSGISKGAPSDFPGQLGTVADREFEVAEGIRATLNYLVKDFNFGTVTVLPEGKTAHITARVVHTGFQSDVWGVSLGQPGELNRLRDKIRGKKVVSLP